MIKEEILRRPKEEKWAASLGKKVNTTVKLHRKRSHLRSCSNQTSEPEGIKENEKSVFINC